jgi:hypothetical protein
MAAGLSWNRRPFGLWTYSDGLQVLFDNQGTPMWERRDGHVHPANPRKRKRGICDTEYFINPEYFIAPGVPERGTLGANKARIARCFEVLEEWKLIEVMKNGGGR